MPNGVEFLSEWVQALMGDSIRWSMNVDHLASNILLYTQKTLPLCSYRNRVETIGDCYVAATVRQRHSFMPMVHDISSEDKRVLIFGNYSFSHRVYRRQPNNMLLLWHALHKTV